MTVLTVSQARATLPHVLDLVERGERVEITRHGKVVAVVAPPTENPRTAHVFEGARQIRAMIEDARTRPFPPAPESKTLTAALAEERVAQLRADRDAE